MPDTKGMVQPSSALPTVLPTTLPTVLPTVLVLASGRGQRFSASGGIGNKLQADVHGKTVLEHTLCAVRASGLPWHLEAADHAGMGDSIAAAVRATAMAAGWLVLPADLPLIQAHTLQRIAYETMPDGVEVIVPHFSGQRAHPVRFSRACAAALQNLHGSDGAAAVVKQFGTLSMAVEDGGCVWDVDTLQDLESVRHHYASRHHA